MCVCACVSVCERERVYLYAQCECRNLCVSCPGTEVIDSYGPCNMGAWNKTRVLCKSNIFF